MKTEIVSLLCGGGYLEKVGRAADVIRRGGLVVFPTETVYGLGADGTSAEAAGRIYEAKGRPSDNPLILHIAEPEDAERYAYTNETYYRLAREFMPGPLTVILPARDTVPLKTRGGLSTVALRCPEHPIARDLIRLCDVAIAAPSANLSGSPSPTVASHVIEDMDGRVDMILDGGDADFGLESTIVRIDGEGELTLLRPGRITPDDLMQICPTVHIADAVLAALKEGELVQSPGMKYRHYAPTAPLALLDGDRDARIRYLMEQSGENIAVLAYSEEMEAFGAALPNAYLYDFGSREDEYAQAHRLFRILRDTDVQECSAIYAPAPKKQGIGLALYNRMIRASAYHIITLPSD